MLEPLLRGLFELSGDDGGLGESEGSCGTAQPMGVTAQLFDCGRVVARRDQAFSYLGDSPQLIAGSLQVLGPNSGGQPEVVDLGLAHGLQDIASLSNDLMNGPTVGLCETCTWVRIATNRRESVFYRCLRAESDPRFVRYPPLPVLQCPGYDRRDSPAQPERDRDEG